MKSVQPENTVKEITWDVHLGSGPGCGQFAVLEPTLHEYAPGHVPAHLQSPENAARSCSRLSALMTTCLGLVPCVGLVMLLAAAAGLAAVAARRLQTHRIARQPAPRKGDPKEVVVLVDFPRSPMVPGPACSVSPFVTRVEAFMRFVGIPYVKRAGMPGPWTPKGQLPYIQHGANRMADSGLIIDYLAETFGVGAEAVRYPPDAQDKAVAVAVERMVTSVLAEAIVYFRFVRPEGWAVDKELMFVGYRLPWLAGRVVRALARKQAVDRTFGTGVAQLSEADMLALVHERLGELSALLGNRNYLFGEQPHAADAAAFGVLDQYCYGGMNPPLREAVQRYPNLVGYVDRIRCAYFGPDYVKSVVWLNDTSAKGWFGAVKERARGRQCAAKCPPSAVQRSLSRGSKEAPVPGAAEEEKGGD